MTQSRLRSLVLAGTAAFALACSGGDDVVGPSSAPSLTVTGGPADLNATAASPTQINLTWVDNATDETQYEVWRSTTGITGTYKVLTWLGANRTSYSDKNLTPGAQYCYKVKATNANGSSASPFAGPACATTPTSSLPPPDAPSALQASAASSSQINLAWQDNSSDEGGFEVWRSTTGASGTFTQLVSVGAGVTTYNNTGLAAGTQYCYKVRATGSGGAPPSAFTSAVCATTTGSALNPPSQLAASTISASQINLSWQDNSTTETGFEVWRSTTGASGTYSLLASVGANATSYNNTGLSAGSQYCYQVRAIAGSSQSAFSASACATTSSAGSGAPTNLNAQALSTTQIRLTWVDNSTTNSQFEVWRSTTGINGTYTSIKWLGGNTTAYTDPNLIASTQYCYKVRAQPGGSSMNSNAACATTLAPDPNAVRVTTYGDSNTDLCPGSGNNTHSYVSVVPRLAPTDPNLACQLAGKIEATWRASHTNSITVVNHAITGSTTGGGGFGGPDRTGLGSPNSRLSINGVARFEAELLGLGYPWTGGEPTNTYYPSGPVTRVRAYTPGTNDFAYISMGTNDPLVGMSTTQTITNLTWMVDRWIATGHSASHFIITTLAPRTDASYGSYIPTVNSAIRSLVASRGTRLVELCDHVSNDNCATWASASFHIGDGVHYTDTVRSWISDQVVTIMSPLIASN